MARLTETSINRNSLTMGFSSSINLGLILVKNFGVGRPGVGRRGNIKISNRKMNNVIP